MADFIPEGQEHLYPKSSRTQFRDFIPDTEAVKVEEATDTMRQAQEYLAKLDDTEENKQIRGILEKLIEKEKKALPPPPDPKEERLTLVEAIMRMPGVKEIIEQENRSLGVVDESAAGALKCQYCGTGTNKAGVAFADDFALKTHIRFCAGAKAALAAKAESLAASSPSPLETWDGDPKTLPEGFAVKEQ